MVGVTAKVRELPLVFGKQGSLLGILAEPSQAALVKDAPAIVLLNAGIIHRVGPNRLYVHLARALASAGYISLRFDHSGIGDSPNRVDALPPLESALSDIREAVDWLSVNKQATKIILLGLCAGADHSILYASSDHRVAGLALLDPSVPRTRRYHLNKFRGRLSNLAKKPPAEALRSITYFLKRTLQWHNNNGTNPGEPIEPSLDDNELRVMFEDHYRQCVLSDVKMLAFFTGGMPKHHNYREQLLDAFPGVAFGNHLTLEYAPQSDHAFSLESHRMLLQHSVLKWLETTPFTNARIKEDSGHQR